MASALTRLPSLGSLTSSNFLNSDPLRARPSCPTAPCFVSSKASHSINACRETVLSAHGRQNPSTVFTTFASFPFPCSNVQRKENRLPKRKHFFKPHAVNVDTEASTEEDNFSFPDFLPPQVTEIEEPAAKSMASKIQLFPVKTDFSSEPILSSCVVSGSSNGPPIVLIHGFDSSCLEWRRLFPLLEKTCVRTYAIDILGWGFSKTDSGVESFSADNKIEHLYQFWKTHISEPAIFVGSSLGGTAAIDFTLKHPDAVSKLVLIDAQGFAEGVGPLKSFPKFVAYIGAAILKSVWLRKYANSLTYFDSSLDTDDAMRVGRLHTLLPGWEDALVSFMLSGGFNVANQIQNISKGTLLIWGEEDKILEKDQVQRFESALQNVKLIWIPQCGHLPHLEKPESVFEALMQFRSEE